MEHKKQNELAREYVSVEMSFLPDHIFTVDQRIILQKMLLESFNDGYGKGLNRGRLSGSLLAQGEVTKVFNDMKSAFERGLS